MMIQSSRKRVYFVGIKHIGLFGRVAREGSGNDIDLMIFVDTETYVRYDIQWGTAQATKAESPSNLRKTTILQTLGIFAFELTYFAGNTPLDMFLFPEDCLVDIAQWQQLSELDVCSVLAELQLYNQESDIFYKDYFFEKAMSLPIPPLSRQRNTDR